MVATVGLSLAGAAHAQQTSGEPATGKEQQGVQSELPTDVPALKRQEATDKEPQKVAERRSDMEAQGVDLSSVGEDKVKEVQRNLQESGYYQGSIDGIPGGATQQAVSRFYRDQAQLAKEGVVVPDAAVGMGLEEPQIEAVEVERVSGQDECAENAQQAQPSAAQQSPAAAERARDPYYWVHAPPAEKGYIR
jgi:peptidoglycan hydrolase-like protein with peptidoglycan-binding domain